MARPAAGDRATARLVAGARRVAEGRAPPWLVAWATARDGGPGAAAARGGEPGDGAAGGAGPGDGAAGGGRLGDGAAGGGRLGDGGRGLPWLHGREGVPWLYLLSTSKDLRINLSIGRLAITGIVNRISSVGQMAEDFFNGNKPMVTKDGKDLTSALEVFVNWCITEVQNKIQRSFHPSSSNRPLKKVVVTIQSLLATCPDPVLIGSLFAGSTEELEVLIKILSVQLDTVLFYTMEAAGDMYFVWRDLPIDPKLFHENMHQSLDRARQSAQNIKGAVDLMSRIESLLVAAPVNIRRFLSFRHFVPSAE